MTESDLERILRSNPDIRVVGDASPAPARQQALLRTAGMSHLAAKFIQLWHLLGGPPLEQEYRFHPRRRWRFDFALPARKLAIEINGGVWTSGRHTRGQGYLRDREKVNAAQLAGWRVFELGTGQVSAGSVRQIVEFIRSQEAQ